MRKTTLFAIATLCTLALSAMAADGPTGGPVVQRNVVDDGLTAACRALQKEVQEAVGNEDPNVYRNHGQYVSRVARMVGPHVDSGEITEECASCIVSQFARRIPIEDQEPCGPDSPNPECTGATCGTFIPCNPGTTCPNPVCVTTAEGGGLCVEGTTPCGGLLDCTATSDCPPGSICAVQTCCDRPVCVPVEAFCPAPGATDKPVVISPASVPGPRIATPSHNVLGEPATRLPWGNVKNLYKGVKGE